MRKKDIDNIDLKILSILVNDASITNKKLSEKINLSPPPTLARVNALRNKGVIEKYKIMVNYNYLKYRVSQMCIAKFKNTSTEDSVKFWKTIPWIDGFQISEPDKITDILTIFAKFKAPEDEELLKSLETVKKFEGLIDLQLISLQNDIDTNNTMSEH